MNLAFRKPHVTDGTFGVVSGRSGEERTTTIQGRQDRTEVRRHGTRRTGPFSSEEMGSGGVSKQEYGKKVHRKGLMNGDGGRTVPISEEDG